MSYTCTMQGVIANTKGNTIWMPNRLVDVDSDYANLQATMLIKSCVYNIDVESGSNTELELTYRDAFSLDVTRKEISKRTSNTGGNFRS